MRNRYTAQKPPYNSVLCGALCEGNLKRGDIPTVIPFAVQ